MKILQKRTMMFTVIAALLLAGTSACQKTAEHADSSDTAMETEEGGDSSDADLETEEGADSSDAAPETAEGGDSSDAAPETGEGADSSDAALKTAEDADSSDAAPGTAGKEDSFISPPKKADLSLGSAGELEGKTLLVSVFANDMNYQWDLTSQTDQATISNIDSYLGIATEYLSEAAADYGKTADFEYDFIKNKELCYYADFDIDAATEDSDDAETAMNEFLDEKVDSDALRNRYQADNIIYFMFLNTDEASKGYSCTRSWYEGMEYPYEIVFLYNVDSGYVNCPAVYAHEMLHAFGAPDLYCEDEEYKINKKFLNYVSERMPNDIMYYCSDMESGEYVYDRITNEVSQLDAYYAGLTDSCELADEYNLGKSQHA